jgi:hypothetical protein
VLVRDGLWIVIDRVETLSEDGALVVFELSEVDEPQPVLSTLRVQWLTGNEGKLTVGWESAGRMEELLDGDVTPVQSSWGTW